MLIGFLLNLPAIELCVIPIVIKLFVELQDSQIYTDALTKLNNRRRITEYINKCKTYVKFFMETPDKIKSVQFNNVSEIKHHEEN